MSNGNGHVWAQKAELEQAEARLEDKLQAERKRTIAAEQIAIGAEISVGKVDRELHAIRGVLLDFDLKLANRLGGVNQRFDRLERILALILGKLSLSVPE